jgi:hypothetical protein
MLPTKLSASLICAMAAQTFEPLTSSSDVSKVKRMVTSPKPRKTS